MNSDSVSEARGRIALRRDQIERELTVIEKIDRIFVREREHSPIDVVSYEARQQRKRELLRLLDEHQN
jgi:hypothetical protein